MGSGECEVNTSAIQLQEEKKSHCNAFFRAVFEATNVINAGAIRASDASQLWFVVGLRSLSSEECQLLARVVKNGGGKSGFSEKEKGVFF